MHKRIGFSILAVSLLSLSPLALAEGTSPIFVTSVGNDRYVGGSDVSVNQPVTGDLLVGGGTVKVNAPVSGSIQALGGTVIIGNTVGGNVRVFGGTVIIMKNVKGNVVAAGGNIDIQKGVEVGGSVLTFGGQTTIDGNVTGNVTLHSGVMALNGIVRGNGDFQGDSVMMNGRIMGNTVIAARTITLGSAAQMDKNLQYWQVDGERTFDNAVKGTATFDPAMAMHDPEQKTGFGMIAGIITALTIYSVLSGALMMGLFLLLTKTFFKDAAKTLKTKPGMSFLIGLLYFLVTPLATVLLLITVIGLPIAIAVALLFLLSIIFAKALTAMVFTRYIEAQYKKKWNTWAIFGISLAIFLFLKMVALVPVVGWIITTAAVLIGYGAVLRVKYERYKKIM